MTTAPSTHYDRVTAAWTLLLGEELHYGVFDEGRADLASATARLTELMVEACAPEPGVRILDVGCGTGAPACELARAGATVVGITTSEEGVRAAQARAAREGLSDRATFEVRDGMDNGLPSATFDRAWVLESSHLMRQRDKLIAECARVLRPGGRIALCDIVLRRKLEIPDVIRLREPLSLLREVYGDARMEPIDEYRRLLEANGLEVLYDLDLTERTKPTFAAWRANAERYHDQVVELIGEADHLAFARSCDVLEGFWEDGTLGYGLVAARKP